MKKIYLTLTITLFSISMFAQIRYVEKVFTDVTVNSNVIYGNNFTIITGAPMAVDLRMDVYEPAGDTATKRPLIIFCHTGSYIPRFANQLPTGDKTDSATVEFAKEFAKRGYVVANISYRQGWNALSADEKVRTSTILQAVYRSMHDAKTAARFFAKEAAFNNNPFKVDTNKIAIGGNGTGGYVAINTISLNKSSELLIDKFINFDSMPAQPYVREAVFGNIAGFGGLPFLNKDNWKNHNADFKFGFTIGGAVGDSSWIESGEAPVVSVHGLLDPFAPYGLGIVFVPGTSTSVVEVSGGGDIMKKVDRLGNNASYKGKVGGNLSRILNTRDGIDGLYTILGQINASGPWEWYDTNFIKTNISNGQAIVTNGLRSNPNMSKEKAMAFIDSICKYVAPRMAISMGFVSNYALSVKDVKLGDANAYPNPVNGSLNINANSDILKIEILDITGKVIKTINENKGLNSIVDFSALSNGTYLVNVTTKNGLSSLKIVKE